MATTSKYFFLTPTADNLNFMDFALSYGSLSMEGEEIKFFGSSRVDSIYVRPGLTYDLTLTGAGADKIYFSGNLGDYTPSTSGANLTLQRTVDSKNETVTLSGGTAVQFDNLVFADGTVSANALYNAVKNTTLLPTPMGETSAAPVGAAAVGSSLNATVKAFAVDLAGETFALSRPNINFIVNGSSGVDKVYVADGATVDASLLGGSTDLIYLRGNWADYTKSLITSNTKIQFTRTVDGHTETVTVTAGTAVVFDRLVFADGSVTTINAKNAIIANSSGPITAVSGYDAGTTTPGIAQTVTTVNISTAPNLSGQSIISGKALANATVSIAIDPDNNAATSNSFTYITTADANGDYSLNLATATPASGTASFVAGTASVSVTQAVPGGASPATVITLPVSTTTSYSASIASDHVTEGGNAVFTVTRSGDTSGAGTVAYATQNGTAGVADYTAASLTTLSFAAGETTKTVTVTTTDDTLVEGNETFNLVLSSPTGGILATSSATATIVDNEGAVFSINNAASGVSFSEGVGTQNFTVIRGGLTTGTDTVMVHWGGGTAALGTDYTVGAADQTLTFAPGETSKTVSAGIVDDTLAEGNETFNVQLTSASAGALIDSTKASLTATIQDNEGAVFRLDNTATGVSFSEGVGTQTFTVTRGGLTTGTDTVVVHWGGGTATLGTDYTVTATDQTLTFAAGETSKTVTATINDDALVEGNETFNVQLASVSAGALIDPSKASLSATIQDNEGAVFSIDNAATGVSLSEGVGTQTFTVTRSGLTTGVDTVVVQSGGGTANGAAGASNDYTLAIQTLTFAAGETSKTVTATINDDAMPEGNETFQVQLLTASTGALINPAAASLTATILDNDQSVWSVASTGNVSEGAGSITYTVTRTGGTSAAHIQFATAGGTATAGSDYTAVNQTLSFAAGEMSKAVTVVISDDAIAEGNETVVGVISNADSGTISTATASATILDNDQSVWSVASTGNVSEGAGSITYTVTRTGGINAAHIQFATTSGTATAGSDYTAVNQTLTFAAGETSKTVTVAITDDAAAEANETVAGVISNADSGTINTALATATILDNDQSIWSVASSGNVDEGAGSITYTVTRTGGANAAHIQFATTGGTATAGSDYTAVSQTLTFAAGEMSKTVSVAVTDDATAEANETVAGAISNADSGTISTATASATILDNDQSIWSVASSGNVSEGAGSITYTVTRTGGANAAHIQFATAGGTATAGSDYTAINQTLTFAAGEMSKSVTVAVSDDATAEANETVVGVISNADSGTINTASATATILDNDQSVWSVAGSGNVDEGAGVMSFTVSRTGDTGTATIRFSTGVLGTAEPGVDYQPVDQTLTFAPGETSKTVQVNLIDDTLAEGTDTFQVLLDQASTGSIAVGSAGGLILDNDQSNWDVASAGDVDEGAGSMTFVVSRSGSLGAGTLLFTTAGGTAQGNVDYTAVNQTLSFAAGETSKVVTVAVSNDVQAESNETVTVFIGNVDTGSGGRSATATILDNDQSIWNVASSGNANESAGFLSYVVSRTGSAAATATIEFSTAGGSATAASDYTATTQTLSFAAGESSKTMLVAITDDTNAESNETVGVVIANASTGSISSTTANGTILDNDQSLWSVSFAGNVAEKSGWLVYTVSRTGLTAGATVEFLTGGGTASATDDYIPIATTLTFAAGETTKQVEVRIVDDTTPELSESVDAIIRNPSTGSVVSGVSVSSILDDDQVLWNVNGPGAVDEGGQFMVFTVSRNIGTNAATTVAATIEVATVGGTATAGADYTAIHQTLTFAAGELSKSVYVPLINDGLREGSETILAMISNATAGTLSNQLTTGTLLDNDQSTWAVASAPAADEGSGFLVYTVSRTGDTSTSATVEFATGGGTATAGIDYTAGSQVLSFAAGETSKNVKVSIADDGLAEGNETVGAAIANASAGLIATPTATATILDNDQSVWSVALSNIGDPGESMGVLLWTVSRTGGTGAATIEFSTVGGSMIGGSDYAAQSRTVLSFAAGETSKTVAVSVTDDAVPEQVENIFVAIGNASSGTIANGVAGSNVYADDQPQWTVSTQPIDEASGLMGFYVTRLGGLDTTATIEFDTGGLSTAAAGQDYTPARQTLSFGIGESVKTIFVPITDDSTGEIAETVMGVLSNPSSGFLFVSTASGTVLANDETRARFAIAATLGSVGEDDAKAFYTITRSGDLGSAQTIDYYTVDVTASGIALAGADYTAVNPTTVTFLAGETTKVVSVNLLSDTGAEGSETLTVGLRNASGGAIVTPTASVTLTDNDTPVASTSYGIAVSRDNVYEGAGALAFTITRSGDTSAATTSYFRTNDVSAVAGTDYTGVANQILTWGVGETTKIVFVNLLDDANPESAKTLTGQVATDSGFTTGTAQVTATILDDDSLATGVNAYGITNTGNVYESAGVAHFTLTRSGDMTITSTSYFRTNGGTAADGADYTAVAGQTLNWGVNENTKIVTVALTNDATAEKGETLIGQIATDSGFTTGTATATSTILDDDAQVMGAGVADVLTTGTASGSYLGGSILNTGDLDDSVTIGAAVNVNSVIDLGAGNDTLNTGATQASFFVNGAQYIGGAGVDTLALSTTTPFNFSTTASPGNFVKGFEIVSMTATGNQTLNLSLQDVLEFTSGNAVADTLRITGSAGDILNLQAQEKTLSTPAPGTGNLTDVDGTTYNVVASAAGNALANDVSIGGSTYDVYQYQHSGHTINLLVNTLLTTSVV